MIQKSLALLLALACTALVAQADPIAFPGAEGFGRFASGGRGGQVIYVTNLNNSGTGSLRAAVSASGPRTVVFAVGGTIHLQSTLRITNGNLTIAGQTAPGGGICIAGYPLDPSNASNVIIRFIRSRLGDTAALENDAFNCRYATDLIIDHCSFSWGIDETATAYDNTRFTMQWCVISESLRDSVHDKGLHGYGGIWGGRGASFHHNLIAHHDSRNPRLNGARYHLTENELVDFRNNVIYNWRSNSCYGGEPASASIKSRHNLINNYYTYGPATASSIRNRILNPSALDGNYGLFHVSGNFVRGYPAITEDNWAGGVQGPTTAQRAAMNTATAFAVAPVITQTAEDAYLAVLAKAGCVLPARDSVDARIIQETSTHTITHTGSRGGLAGIIDSQDDVGGWPMLDPGTALPDTDADGMPDAWEIANNLNPSDPSDRNLTDANGYTRLENYLNSLAAPAFPIPEISAQPEAATISAGAPFALFVTASGAAPFTYQWLKDGQEIADGNGPSYQVDAAAPGDEGSYQVNITNPYGTVKSDAALISLAGPAAPSFVTGPSDIQAVLGEAAQLQSAASGSEPLTYQWHRSSGQPVPGATSANLDLPSVSTADAGNYYLVVSNSSGTAISPPARISVRVPATSNVVFSTTFGEDTIHAASPALTPSSTNWHIMSSKNASASSVGDNPATQAIEARPLTLTMPITTSGIVEAAAFVANPPMDAATTNSTIKTRIIFTPVNVRTLSLGLFNSGGATPYNGLINSLLVNTSTNFATGGTSHWRGYRTAIFENSTTYAIDARPPQPETNNTSQALIVPGTSSSFQNIVTVSGLIPPSPSFSFSDNQSHTLSTKLIRNSPDTYIFSWNLQVGTEFIASGAVTTTEAAATPQAIASLFDALAIGYRNRDNSVISKLTVHELEVTTGSHDLIADPYEAFLHSHGLDPLAAGAFDQDPDDDGIANGIEFILGTNPSQSSSQQLPVLTGNEESGWTFSFMRGANAAESAEIVIERSTDLFGWQPLAGLQSSLTPMENEMLLETLEIPAGESSLYLRLKATRK